MARLIEYPQGLAQALAAPPMRRAVEAKVERARVFAIAISPERTGMYRFDAPNPQFPGHQGGFWITFGRTDTGAVKVRLINLTPYAVYLEFGTRYMRRQRILGRTIDYLKI